MWKTLVCSESQANLSILLACGQSFRWKIIDPVDGIWIGVLAKRLWLIKQDKGEILYQTVTNEASVASESQIPSNNDILRDYLQLHVDLPSLYKRWSQVDDKFAKIQDQFKGIRMLRQDPVENLFSFICSQNNNIPRISQLVEALCANFGEKVAKYDGTTYYAFPTVKRLASKGVEEKLRKLSFGYRAKYISGTAKAILKSGGDEWLMNLRKLPYEEAHASLCSLPGVGPKVGDCVCLMSLDKADAIPVDTHMWQIAIRDYLPHLRGNKTLTDSTYKQVGDFFRELYGDYAGWAHSVLFSADLKRFEGLKAITVKEEVKKPVKKKSTKRRNDDSAANDIKRKKSL